MSIVNNPGIVSLLQRSVPTLIVDSKTYAQAV
jgi:hypothetical protein